MIESLVKFDDDFAQADTMPLAGVLPNGFYVLTFPCGTEKRFRVYTRRANAREHKGKRLIGLLIGPVGTDEYEDAGFVTDAGIQLTPGYDLRKLRDWFDILWAIQVEPAGELARALQPLGYRLSLEKRCFVCNRALNPAAWKSGVNKHCEKKWGG